MTIKRNYFLGLDRLAPTLVIILLAACGQGGGSSSGSKTTPPVINQTGTSIVSLTTVPSATGNNVPLIVDAGPVPVSSSVNVGYVTVTVCTPGTSGTTAACQTIDHITVDTGSYGLRLLNSVLSSKLTLPPVVSGSGQAIAECVPFVLGTTWGSVRSADIYIGGEVARGISIQDIGDYPGGAPSVPSDCSSKGNLETSLTQLGANGILGVGPFKNDCDLCLVQVVPATYYTCTTAGCINSTVSAAQVVTNPVASFATDKNGVQINLPALTNLNQTGMTGSLIFGIGTQPTANPSTNIVSNSIPGTANYYGIDTHGNFTTTYNGAIVVSYIDSGSNGLFFNDMGIPTIPTCSVNTWAYCPTSTISLNGINTTYGTKSVVNNSATSITSVQVTNPIPTIVNADNLFTNANVVAANIGGPAGTSSTFAWGLPFFYGRPVFTAIAGVNVPSVQQGPYWAY